MHGFSDAVDGKHAFCRNPNPTDYRERRYEHGPWCYVSYEGLGEYCDVPFCPPSDGEECDIRVDGHCVSESPPPSSFRSRRALPHYAVSSDAVFLCAG